MSEVARARVAYITTCFGALSHTFMRREIRELQELGLDITLYGIRRDISSLLSPEEQALVEATTYVYPLRVFGVLSAHVRLLIAAPVRYCRTLARAIRNEERSPGRHLKMVYHFFVSSWLALDMRRRRITHIHAHFMNVPATITMYCAGLLGIPFSVTNHTGAIRPLRHMLGLKEKLRRARFLCAVSGDNQREMNRIWPCAQKSYVIRCGVEIHDHASADGRGAHGPRESIKVLGVGRFVEVKGFEYLIQAIKVLEDRQVPATLTLVGDGELRADLERVVRECRLEHAVVFAGYVKPSDLQAIFTMHDVCVVPSIETGAGVKEGIPVVIMEAMAAGVPVIATGYSGIPEIVRDGESGLLVPEKDPVGIAEGIVRIVREPGLRDTLVANGRRVIVGEFNAHANAKRKHELFEQYV